MWSAQGDAGFRGYSFPEVLAVLSIVGILVSMATPRLHGFIVRARVRGALEVLRGDLSHARMLAARSGHGAVVRFLRDPACVEGDPRAGRAWRVSARGPAAYAAAPQTLAGPVCYAWNGSDSLVFTSRGLLAPFNNRTIHVREAGVRDSLTVSVAGRVLYRGP